MGFSLYNAPKLANHKSYSDATERKTVRKRAVLRIINELRKKLTWLGAAINFVCRTKQTQDYLRFKEQNDRRS